MQAPDLVSAAAHGCATPGIDGPNAALTGVVNTYYPATANASAGATTISVGAPIGAAQPIAPGDLLLVIQMQDADINGANTIAYGDGSTGRGSTALNSTGLYEYVSAASAVVAGVVTLGNGLVNNYHFSAVVTATSGVKTFQVIRVPQYSSATLGAGLTTAAWNGAVHAGGVLAIDVAGGLNLNTQTISVNQLGFKGGLGVQQNGPANGATGTDYVVPSLHGQHGYKAEGIGGTPHYLYDALAAAQVTGAADGYPGGDAARGAPGNAGGGGTDSSPTDNQENTGGGGGGNGNQGGLGGNAWQSIQPVGGLGGAIFPAAATRLALGGGGGAGSRNNSSGFMSSGGTGGGMVMVRSGSVSGTGTIMANGGAGITPDNDGGGGGGAGGSVLVTTNTGNLGGLTINADGAVGTNAWPGGPPGTAGRHGPGGGGSGGVIITSSAPLAASVLGGPHGTTTNGPGDAYGSTDGMPGQVLSTTPGAIPGSSSGAECLPVLTVTKTTSTAVVTNTAGGTTATYSITVANAANTAPATGIAITDALPAGFTYLSTGSVALNGGATRTAVVNPLVGDTNPAFGTFSIPGAGSVVITFSVHIAAGVPNGTYSNPATATYLSPTRTTIAGTTSTNYPGGGPERVTVGTPADIGVTKTVSNPNPTVGTNVTFTITATNIGPSNATGVQVTDPVPAGLTLVSTTPSAGTTYAAGVWNIGALANGASATLAIVATVNTTSPITNTATKSAELQLDPNAANNAASATVTGLPGLPNTSAPFAGDGGLATPQTPGSWLAVLSTIAGLGAIALAVITVRASRPRFRRRRSRAGFRQGRGRLTLCTSAVVAGMVLGFASAGQLGAYVTARSTALSAVAGAPDIGGGPTAATELIGSRYVTKTPPSPPPVAETFHLAGGPITPARLRIPSIGVDARVDGIGLRGDGSMDVPDNLWTSSWLSTGPRPGQVGKSVIAGHRGIGTPALFSHLEDVQAGDRIYISDAARGQLVFEVTRVASLDLSNATQVEVFGPTSQQQLVLVTCYGRYMAGDRTYDHRLVVFSRLLTPS